jgi:hypothetical protein
MSFEISEEEFKRKTRLDDQGSRMVFPKSEERKTVEENKSTNNSNPSENINTANGNSNTRFQNNFQNGGQAGCNNTNFYTFQNGSSNGNRSQLLY